MTTLNVNISKLSSKETVRYSGPQQGQHGVYTLNLFPDALPGHQLQIHMSLEALMQLKARIEASLQHMISH